MLIALQGCRARQSGGPGVETGERIGGINGGGYGVPLDGNIVGTSFSVHSEIVSVRCIWLDIWLTGKDDWR
jgi:hypothetical protein